MLHHWNHHLFCEIRQTLDTHHPAITQEQCEYYLPFRAGADNRICTCIWSREPTDHLFCN